MEQDRWTANTISCSSMRAAHDRLSWGSAIVGREYLKEVSRCMIQKAAYVRFDEVIHTLLLDGASQGIQALVRTPLGTVAVATVFEERLEQGFEHAFGGQFHNLVFEAPHPQLPTFLTSRLPLHPPSP